MKVYLGFLVALLLIIAGVALYGPRTSAPSEPIPPSAENPSSPAQPASDEGRIVIALTDAAVDLKSIDSILISISEVRVHSVKRGWITVSEVPKQFDLLRLKETNALGLLVDGNIEAGSYDQVRLTIKSIKITTGSITEDAKLPSGDLKIQGSFVVENGKTASVVLDFLADKSLHKTGSGRFIFAPVVHIESKRNADATIQSNNNVEIKGGEVTTDATVGMNENGDTSAGFVLDPKGNLKLEIIGEAIRVIAADEKEANITVTAQAAVESAVKNNAIDSALSIKLVTREGKKVWRVGGLKNFEVVNVFIDTSTGGVIATE